MEKKTKEVGNIPSSQMDCKEIPFPGLEQFAKFDALQDLIRSIERTEYKQELREYEKGLLKKNDKADEDNKSFMLSIISVSKSVKPLTKQRETADNVPDNDNDSYAEDEEADYVSDSYSDCCSSEESDPPCALFLSNLKLNGTSYLLEDVRDGVPLCSKYEDDSCSDEDCGHLDEECEQEPRRKLRSAMKQEKVGPSNDVENKRKRDSQSTRGKSRNKVKSEKIDNIKCSTNGMVPEPQYLTVLQSLKIVDGHLAFSYEGQSIVYQKSNGDNNREKKKHDDACFSDIEILDITTVDEDRNLSPSEVTQSEFRHKVIAILRKPFDQEEYDKLWLEVEQRKPECRHLELRDGRERSCPTNKDGKSYLDHHPDFGIKLYLFRDDKPKCLNLLRGFFFWIQNFLQDGSFQPWQDEECLAIKQESC